MLGYWDEHDTKRRNWILFMSVSLWDVAKGILQLRQKSPCPWDGFEARLGLWSSYTSANSQFMYTNKCCTLVMSVIIDLSYWTSLHLCVDCSMNSADNPRCCRPTGLDTSTHKVSSRIYRWAELRLRKPIVYEINTMFVSLVYKDQQATQTDITRHGSLNSILLVFYPVHGL